MRISTTLSLYVGRHFFFWLMSVLLIIMGLILLFDMLELVRRAASQQDVSMTQLLEMAVLKLPQMLNVVMPFAVMIGAMIVFQRLSKVHELVIIRAAGVSVWQFLAPLVGFVFLFGVLAVTVFNPVSAAMFSRYEKMEDDLVLRRASPLSFSQGGMWLREASEDRQMVIHAGAVRQEDFQLKMREMTIFVFDAQGAFKRRFEAATGELGDGVITLRNAWVMEQGVPSAYTEETRLPTTLTLAKVQESFASPQTMSFWDLPKFISFFEAAGFSAHAHKMQYHSLLASPLLLCAMIVLAAVFAMRPNPRRGGMLWRIVGGVASGFMLYFFSKVTYALGMSNTLPLVLAAWSPATVTVLIGAGLLFHQEDG